MWNYVHSEELYHHGIKGMKWGVRRFRNRNGSLTPAGRKRYADDSYTVAKKAAKAERKQAKSDYKQSKKDYKQAKKTAKENMTPEEKAARRKKAIKIGAAAAGTALAVYGAYKLNKYVKTSNYNIAAERGREYAAKQYERASKEAWDALENPLKYETYRKVHMKENAHLEARRFANDATKDNFVTAAKNVRNYKRSGGNLKEVNRINYDYYFNYPGREFTYSRDYVKNPPNRNR